MPCQWKFPSFPEFPPIGFWRVHPFARSGGRSAPNGWNRVKRDLKRNSPLSVVAVAWGRSMKGWTLHIRPVNIRWPWPSLDVTENRSKNKDKTMMINVWSEVGPSSWAFQKLDKTIIEISVKMTRQEQGGVWTMKNRHRCTRGRVI